MKRLQFAYSAAAASCSDLGRVNDSCELYINSLAWLQVVSSPSPSPSIYTREITAFYIMLMAWYFSPSSSQILRYREGLLAVNMGVFGSCRS
jgi:hypothetical protein